jgi:hypothetical protein
MWKGWTLLNVVVRDELEDAALRKDGRFIVNGSIGEVEGQLRRNVAAARHLNQVPISDNLAIVRAQFEKAVQSSHDMPDQNGSRLARGLTFACNLARGFACNFACGLACDLRGAAEDGDEGQASKALQQKSFHSNFYDCWKHQRVAERN